jgi:HNH endonuclease
LLRGQLPPIRYENGRFKTGTTHNIIDCACGCKTKIYDRGPNGQLRRFVKGHQNRGREFLSTRGEKHCNWKGGRSKRYGYWLVLKPEHPRKDGSGYVFEHIVIYETHHKCCILPWIVVHHKNRKRWDNRPQNLVLVTKSEHQNIHNPREDYCQICERCVSTNIRRNGFGQGKQVFYCKDCGITWRAGKIVGIDYGQICQNCNSRHVVKNGGIRNDRQRFQCRDCKNRWGIPVADLVIKRSGNDMRYKEKKKHKLVVITT